MTNNIYIKCPHCGATLSLPEEFKNDKQLHCSKCNKNFENVSNKQFNGANGYQNANNTTSSNLPSKKRRKRGSKEIGTKGKIIISFIILALSLLVHVASPDSIKVDGQTIYVITKDIYAPTTEEAAKDLIHFTAENQNDDIARLEYMVRTSNDMELMSQGDRVVVVKQVSSGYKIRRLSDYQTAIIPNEKYLRQEK